MNEVIWVTDQDLCDMCGELLDDWNICPACGYDGVEWEREEEDGWDEDEEVYYVGEIRSRTSGYATCSGGGG